MKKNKYNNICIKTCRFYDKWYGVCAYKPRTWVAEVGGTQIITVIVFGKKRWEDHD